MGATPETALFTVRDPNRSIFPIPSPNIIDELTPGRFQKLGYAFGIEDPSGALFMYPHNENPDQDIAQGAYSVPSETALGKKDEDGRITDIESIEEGLSRCLFEEQRIELEEAPAEAIFSVVRKEHILMMRWDKEHPLHRVYGLSVTFVANDPMVEFLLDHAQPTPEAAAPGKFMSQAEIQQLIDLEQVRPGFDQWFYQHQASLQSGLLQEPVVMPIRPVVQGEGWVNLKLGATATELSGGAVYG